jgi:predicted amidohydrolase YtcJ
MDGCMMMTRRSPRLFLLTTAFVSALALTGCQADDANAPDLVLVGGTVITVDPATPDGEAVAIQGGRILAVGSSAEIREMAGPSTQVEELEGRVVLPGFIEGHGHFLGLGNAKMILDLSRTTTFDQIVELVAEAAATAEPGAWILGRGWHQERWNPAPAVTYEGVATHQALSAVSPDNPVLLTHASGHGSFANARAMELAGIDRNTPNPTGGTIVKDADGNPTGFLRQAAQGLVGQVRAEAEASMTDAERQARLERQVELAGEEALRYGITSFHDMGSTFAEIDGLRALADQGRLPVRLHVSVRGESNEEMDRRLPEYRVIGHGNHFLTVRAIKRSIDGALGTHGAWMLEPYADLPTTSGLPQLTPENLRETAEVAYRHGFQMNTHAIGDRGNREALNIYEAVMGEDPAGQDLRWRIEHAQNLHPDEVPRFARMGVTASMQGIHATSDGPWVPQRLGMARARERAYVWRSLMDAGATICNGTDVPVEPISAVASYTASVTRQMANGERFFQEQAMSRMEALRSYTIHCARAVFEEELLGSVTPGKLADLVVVDRNPLTVAEAELGETVVEMTLVGGEVRYRR